MSFSWLRTHAAFALLAVAQAIDLPQYAGLKTSSNNSVLEVTFHNSNSTINVWNRDIQDGMVDLVRRLQQDNETKVVIFRSDVPRYFLAHFDVAMPNLNNESIVFAELMYNITALPQVTIAAVEGRARGAGNELLLASDMRFATKIDTYLSQLEVGTGAVPGGGGSQHLPKLIGRGLAMEYILSANDITASEAERIGWINKAFENSGEMNAYIDRLTSRLRVFSRSAMSTAKDAINLHSRPTREAIVSDALAYGKQSSDPTIKQVAAKIQALSATIPPFEMELNLGESLPQLYV